MFSAAERLPGGAETAGANDTVIWQLLPAARLGAHGLASAKSPAFAPDIVIPLTPAADVPRFEIVTICEAPDVPSLCDANPKLGGET